MRLEKLYNEEKCSIINGIITHERYALIRIYARRLAHLDKENFCIYFDYVLADVSQFFSERDLGDFANEEEKNEYIFLTYLEYRLLKAVTIISNYLEHVEKIEKKKSDWVLDEFKGYNLKYSFLKLKLGRRSAGVEVKKEIETTIIRELKPIEDINTRLKDIELKEGEINLGNISNKEKIIMLNELGILEFLKQKTPFDASVNSLARVISAITGMKTESIQSDINPMFNPKSSQKNNPYETKKTVEKAKQILATIGYIPPK